MGGSLYGFWLMGVNKLMFYSIINQLIDWCQVMLTYLLFLLRNWLSMYVYYINRKTLARFVTIWLHFIPKKLIMSQLININ